MSTAVDEPDIIIAESDGAAVLATLERSQLDQQIATAKRWPRSIKKFKDEAMQLATLDEETAASMFYVLPRGGKSIEGPSARLAEVVGSAWGNLRYGSRVISVDDSFITAQGVAFDLEKNISASVDVRRRITDSRGRRYNDDMIVMTGNAAAAIALRNAIFKVVPFALVKSIYDAAKLTSVGKASSLVQTRAKAITALSKMGATEPQILQALGKAGIDDIGLEDIITLRGWYTALKDGDTKLEDLLGPAPDMKKGPRPSALNEQLKPQTTAPTEPVADQTPVEHPKPPAPEDVSQERPSEDDNADWQTALNDELSDCELISSVGPIGDKYIAQGCDKDAVLKMVAKRREQLTPAGKRAKGALPGMADRPGDAAYGNG